MTIKDLYFLCKELGMPAAPVPPAATLMRNKSSFHLATTAASPSSVFSSAEGRGGKN
eukprot:CAMPEP_0114427602 /NCGR_PEP_ID=MMETSP0103-20121206/8443_1 /TAXON_ID=37642 ORGANISM="Paraphysomonas imperforata, Strain PA2" /NCGR_SAMPLE_ID=MMETSP0103 /ASSEMBLY_ACC=CAM_ASM_000201 /LENGTH=56 /DNA_ID=CAMNT_0001596689 /DNA_START=1054 /DNA_END=1224 /DNA_ORIENTATION=+